MIRPTTPGTRSHRTLVRTIVVLGVLASFPLASVALGQEPGGWPQFQRDGAHSAAAPGGPQPPYRVAWEYPIERVRQRGASPAVIAGDLAITIGPDAVHAVELSTGTAAWTLDRDLGPPVAPALVEGERTLLLYTEGGGIEDPSGSPTAGPTGADEDPDAGSSLIAIDLETREPAWDSPHEMEGAIEAPPVVDGETAVIGDVDGTLAAVDVRTGEEVWSTEAGGEVLRPPAVAEQTVVLSLREGEEIQPTVTAFDLADGERLWSVQPSVAAGNPFTTVPAIGEGSVFLGAFDRTARSFALNDGAERWSNADAFRFFAPITAPALTEGELYLADDAGGVHRYDAATGEVVWSFALNSSVSFGAPAVVGDVVVVGLADGSLAAIDRDEGLLRSRIDAGNELGPIAVAADLLVGARADSDAGLVAFAHADGAPTAVTSPSVIRPATLVGLWAAAAAIVAAALLLPLRLVGSRIRPSPVQADAEDGPVPQDELAVPDDMPFPDADDPEGRG